MAPALKQERQLAPLCQSWASSCNTVLGTVAPRGLLGNKNGGHWEMHKHKEGQFLKVAKGAILT